MNILIVGNGFDLAHGLPTKYADFLKFIDFFYKHKAQESSGLELIAGEDINCYKYFTDLFNSKQDSEFDQYLYDQSRKTIHELSLFSYETTYNNSIRRIINLLKKCSKYNRKEK